MEKLDSPEAKRVLSRNLGEEAIEQINQGFEEGRNPYGDPWAPPRLRTASSVSPLRDTGRLQRSFHLVETSTHRFVVETNVIYASVHQYGAVIKAKPWRNLRFRGNHYERIWKKLKRAYGDWILGKGVKIPQRMMMPENGLPESWAKAFIETASDVFHAYFDK